MSNSDLHTSAIATGGTNFDTATCIGGKCEYPLQQYGNEAKIYTHIMMQTQNKYDPPEFNSTLEAYDATNAPNGSKPERSPFDDDEDAFFVGDSNMNNAGNGLVTFTRKYATIPPDHSEPYGLYTRTTPGLATETLNISASDVNNVNLIIQYKHKDTKEYYDVAQSGNQSDFNHDASNLITSTTFPANSQLGTFNGPDYNNSDKIKRYEAVRAKYVFTYTDLSQDLFVGARLKFQGTYNKDGKTLEDHMSVYLTEGRRQYVYVYRGDSYYRGQTRHISLGNLFTITSKTENLDSNGDVESYTFEAVTLPVDITGKTATFGYSYSSKTSSISTTAQVGKVKSGSTGTDQFGRIITGNTTIADMTLHTSGRQYTLAGSVYGVEVNSPSNIKYRYVKSDDPNEIILNEKFPIPITLTTDTVPSLQGYRDMVQDRVYIGVENEYIERYIGNIYRIAQIESLLQ